VSGKHKSVFASVRTSAAKWKELADKERRKLGNIGEVLLEWALEQPQAAGSIDRLMKFNQIERSQIAVSGCSLD